MIQGHTNTRQMEFLVFFKVSGPLAQAIRRSQSKQLKSFTKPKIGLQINHSTA